MPRAGLNLQSGTKRNFINGTAAVLALASSLGISPRSVRTVPTPSGEMPFCSQVRLWAEADVVLTPNGAHFVNAPFLPPGALLLEGMPFGMSRYIGQRRVTAQSGIEHVRLFSARPPIPPGNSGGTGWRAATVREADCERLELCARFFRDKTDIVCDPSNLISAVRAARRRLTAAAGAASSRSRATTSLGKRISPANGNAG